MKLPTKLTISRLIMAAALLILLTVSFPWSKTLALIVFISAGITDYLDGYLARTKYGTTDFGALLDPLADKVLVCAAFVSFVELQLLPAWIVVIIITREFLVTGLRLLAATKGQIISAGPWGKHKTLWQIIIISFLLLGLAIRNDALRNASTNLINQYDHFFFLATYILGIAVAIITTLSGLIYFFQNQILIRKQS